jgi:nicotinamidase-related amidase
MSSILKLNLRKQELLLDENGYRQWQVVEAPLFIPSERVTLVLCDVWDHHWCRGAEERLEKMLPRMNSIVKAARQVGTLIVHAPSETMDFYKDTPARLRVLAITPVAPPKDREMVEPALPVDAADGGCDTVDNYAGVDKQVWTRQHPAIEINQELDAITDNGRELYSLIQQKGIQQLILLGVHTNMCILNRSFAIKQMVRWRQNIALMRDLTDAMYNPASAPYVSHVQGTQLVIDFIEKHWCPTLSSTDILPLA